MKNYYNIAEISKITGVPTHTIRYWEREFGDLSIKRNRLDNKMYNQLGLAKFKVIKWLLKGERFSIKGAKKKFESMNI